MMTKQIESMLSGYACIGFTSLLFAIFSQYALAHSFEIPADELHIIANKIWQNECNKSYDGLTSWNPREEFASLGIGHFIWYPAGKKKIFAESFPSLLQYMQKKGTKVPAWLVQCTGCPWNTREEFLEQSQAPLMKEFRKFLHDTRDDQAAFMAERLQNSIPKIVEKLHSDKQQEILAQFRRVLSTPMGLYALLDYVNFKGEGMSSDETYQGQGWGLLQVLQGMGTGSKDADPLKEFVASAKKALEMRVRNSPRNREEWKWLRGWFNRLDTYLSPIPTNDIP